jgi:hypothetical protein
VLAFLRKRLAAADTMARRSPEEGDYAKQLRDQIAIQIEMIAQGLHVGDAACEDALRQAQGEREALETSGFADASGGAA